MLPTLLVTKANERHHVAMVIESGDSRVYIYGLRYGDNDTTTFDGIDLRTSSSVSIGKGMQGQRRFQGMTKDLRIWKNTTRTDEDIVWGRFVEHSGPEAGLAILQK